MDPAKNVADLVAALKADGHDFTVGIPMNTPITKAERVVSAGRGIGSKENMRMIAALARTAGAAIGSSRPVAETLKYVPMDRFVGMSGQKFAGNLYIACGISGAVQHLKGIQDASTVVAINIDPNAPIFKHCDYGIVGDLNVILPLLADALETGDKKPAPPMVKMPRPADKIAAAAPAAQAPSAPVDLTGEQARRYVCSGCGYEYDPAVGDPAAGIAPGPPPLTSCRRTGPAPSAPSAKTSLFPRDQRKEAVCHVLCS